MTPCDCQKLPKFCHMLESFHKLASSYFLALSPSPPLPGIQAPDTSSSLLFPRPVFPFCPYFCSHCSLHCDALSPLLHHRTLLSVKALIQKPPPLCSTLWSLWSILLSSGIFTAPHWCFHVFLVSCLHLPLF